MTSESEKIARKGEYKELIEKGSVIGENIENAEVLESFNNILGIIEKCDAISSSYAKEGRIENAGDYLMDAQILKMSHDLLGTAAEKMGNCDFSEDEYVQILFDMLSSDENDGFKKLSKMATECCKVSHFPVSMLGTFDYRAPPPAEKEKKERRKSGKAGDSVKAPVNVKQMARHDQGAEKINAVLEEIRRVGAQRGTNEIPYFELICDPENFMKTVEMAFQVSFMVRDGTLGLKSIKEVPHVVIKSEREARAAKSNKNQETKQCIMSIDPSLWRQKVKQYKLKEPLIKLNMNQNTQRNDMMMEAECDSD